MNKRAFALALILVMVFGSSFTSAHRDAVSFKCLIQLKNYGGEGAYVVASLLDPDGNYVKTLSVSGDDEEWYEDMPDWYTFHEGADEDIDNITGASIASGGRKITVLEMDRSRLEAGFKLRFETAVEDQDYFAHDVEIELSSTNVKKKLPGNGFIRYVQLIQK